MNKSERAFEIIKILDKTYPEIPVPLDHVDNFTLLIAVLLSAQCTDERVNQITPSLFSVASDPLSMSKISVNKIYKIIKPCGLGPLRGGIRLVLTCCIFTTRVLLVLLIFVQKVVNKPSAFCVFFILVISFIP